jgi:exosome complex RNA-binding protein Csl4
MTRLILHYSAGLIESTLATFDIEDSHTKLRKAIKASIFATFQSEQMKDQKGKDARSAFRLSKDWVRTKIFLDHDLLDILIKVCECHYGSHFAMTPSSLEGLFHKTEWLPVSNFYNL